MAHRMLRHFAASTSAKSDSAHANRGEEFARLLEQHERYVYAYILSLVPSRDDAEEILQETYVRLFQKADQFSGDFRAWACAVARFQVLTYRKRIRRDKLRFSQEFVDAIVAHRGSLPSGSDGRAAALGECLEKLSASDRQLLDWIYRDNWKVDQAARATQRTAVAVYKALSRIRAALYECIERTRRLSQREA